MSYAYKNKYGLPLIIYSLFLGWSGASFYLMLYYREFYIISTIAFFLAFILCYIIWAYLMYRYREEDNKGTITKKQLEYTLCAIKQGVIKVE